MRNLTKIATISTVFWAYSAHADTQLAVAAAVEPREAQVTQETPRSYGIYEYRAGELYGRSVKMADGKHLGEIQDLAIEKREWRLHAVMEVGGFLGLGATDIAVPLENLVERDRQLYLVSPQSRDELLRTSVYDSRSFMTVASRQLLRPLALRRLRAMDEQQADNKFDRIDSDADGFVSTHEWAVSSRDGRGWGAADRDANGRLDRVEFSAFETIAEPTPQPSKTQPREALQAAR